MTVQAQMLRETAHVVTDKALYLTGERLHVSICITGNDGRPSGVSRVAYVELSDPQRICAQGLVALTDGCGWADITLPATMHSGNYLMSVYTRAMRNASTETFCQKVVSVINATHISRQDAVEYSDPVIMAPDSLSAGVDSVEHFALPATYPVTIQPSALALDDVPLFGALSVSSCELEAADYSSFRPALRPMPVDVTGALLQPEVEGHLVTARPVERGKECELTRLVLVGKAAAVYDGQLQPDSSYIYYTTGLYGTLPTLINGYDFAGNPVPMELQSPFARVLPQSMPPLRVAGTADGLLARSLRAQQDQAITDWMAMDTVAHNTQYQASSPHYFYDLEEWTRFNTVREILVEFVMGVRRQKSHGVNKLYTFDPVSHSYSEWPALVLLDGMPVYDVDEILDYDAHLLRYVQIYTDKYSFGGSFCQGIISFISERGRLPNFKLDAGSRMVSYPFPQDHPLPLLPASAQSGTLLWQPDLRQARPEFALPTVPGLYQALYEGLDADGMPFRRVMRFEVR